MGHGSDVKHTVRRGRGRADGLLEIYRREHLFFTARRHDPEVALSRTDENFPIGDQRKGDFWILAAGRENKVLAMADFKKPISATPTAANGVLYIATMSHLYALAVGDK